MKMTKCDRCGLISTVNPTTKNLEFPIIHITKADDIFQSVSPREIDLCRECRKELDGWLTKKPVDVMREKMREDMKATTEISRIIDETVKKMAEEGTETMVRPVPCRDKKAEKGESTSFAAIELMDDLISAYHKGIEDLYDLRVEAVRRVTASRKAADADGETIKKKAEPSPGGMAKEEETRSPFVYREGMREAGVEVLDDLISAYHKGIEDLYHLREDAVRRAAAADGETE